MTDGTPADMAATLAERGARYGSWRTQAEIAQGIKEGYRLSPNWHRLPAYMRETLDINANKAARALNGDHMYLDNWHDMTNYCRLAEDCLKEDIAAGVAPPVVGDPAHPLRPRWRDNRFGYWLPVKTEPGGHWVVMMERMGKAPLMFIDEMDESRGYKMDEDEALDRARSLNAMNFTGYDACHEHWLAKPVEDPARVASDMSPISFEERLALALRELEELGFHEDRGAILNEKEEAPHKVLADYIPQETRVKDPAFFNDPVRAFFASQNNKEQGSGG